MLESRPGRGSDLVDGGQRGRVGYLLLDEEEVDATQRHERHGRHVEHHGVEGQRHAQRVDQHQRREDTRGRERAALVGAKHLVKSTGWLKLRAKVVTGFNY